MTQLIGIDVAGSYQHGPGGGVPNWKSVGTVVDFAVAKASQGTGFNDPLIRQNLAGMRTNAVIPFAYHFLDTNGSGADQYDHFINCVGDVTGVGFALDVEHGGVGSRIVQFLDRHVHPVPRAGRSSSTPTTASGRRPAGVT